ncbi:MAG: DUF4352 domain-containing protein [Candidatus Solibacter usitatus]|nr:DUF4352 domain-containing protein [Candidatus Solibacter usitatus]
MAILLTAGGCSGIGKSGDSGKTYTLGSDVSVGQLTYTVVHSEWRESLDSEEGPRLPKDRFLVLTLRVSNRGGGELGVPLLTLVGEDGKEYREQDKGLGVPQWLGLLRTVRPAETENGRILFDAPQAGYKLRVVSGGDVETEKSALVEIPLHVAPPPVKSVDPLATPAAK